MKLLLFIMPISNQHRHFVDFQPLRGGGLRHDDPHHNFVVYAPVSMKFGTGVELDVFHTTVTKMP